MIMYMYYVHFDCDFKKKYSLSNESPTTISQNTKTNSHTSSSIFFCIGFTVTVPMNLFLQPLTERLKAIWLLEIYKKNKYMRLISGNVYLLHFFANQCKFSGNSNIHTCICVYMYIPHPIN